MNDLIDKLKISKPTFFGVVKKLGLDRKTDLKKRSGKQAKRERYFTLDEVLMITAQVKKGRNKAPEAPKKVDPIFNSYQRIIKW
jgi:hypothetical protein